MNTPYRYFIQVNIVPWPILYHSSIHISITITSGFQVVFVKRGTERKILTNIPFLQSFVVRYWRKQKLYFKFKVHFSIFCTLISNSSSKLLFFLINLCASFVFFQISACSLSFPQFYCARFRPVSLQLTPTPKRRRRRRTHWLHSVVSLRPPRSRHISFSAFARKNKYPVVRRTACRLAYSQSLAA